MKASQHLNYCRSMSRQFSALLQVPSVSEQDKIVMHSMVDLASASQKFMLPVGGMLIEDYAFKGLDEDIPLNLPFQFIALEYPLSLSLDQRSSGNAEQIDAYIVFAREREDGIAISACSRYLSDGYWDGARECIIPRTQYLDRSDLKDGLPAFIFRPLDKECDPRFYKNAVIRLLAFLNALSCSNVKIERSDPKKLGRTIKSALPFDSYHILTIDARRDTQTGTTGGSHRSPREHLRRGHIRRIDDGRRIWVNASVVGAGRGAGIVSKNYRITA